MVCYIGVHKVGGSPEETVVGSHGVLLENSFVGSGHYSKVAGIHGHIASEVCVFDYKASSNRCATVGWGSGLDSSSGSRSRSDSGSYEERCGDGSSGSRCDISSSADHSLSRGENS